MNIPLGIEIYSELISDDFYNSLLEKYKSLKPEQRKFQNHNYNNGGDYNFVTDDFKEYYKKNILLYVKEYTKERDGIYDIDDQWINVQAHNDFVPLHEHACDLSYVIYLKLPQYLQDLYLEYNKVNRTNHKGLTCVEGCIEFHYGIKNSLFPCSKKIVPKERQILIFPSQILHYVYPFSDPSEPRVSISGNLIKEK